MFILIIFPRWSWNISIPFHQPLHQSWESEVWCVNVPGILHQGNSFPSLCGHRTSFSWRAGANRLQFFGRLWYSGFIIAKVLACVWVYLILLLSLWYKHFYIHVKNKETKFEVKGLGLQRKFLEYKFRSWIVKSSVELNY